MCSEVCSSVLQPCSCDSPFQHPPPQPRLVSIPKQEHGGSGSSSCVSAPLATRKPQVGTGESKARLPLPSEGLRKAKAATNIVHPVSFNRILQGYPISRLTSSSPSCPCRPVLTPCHSQKLSFLHLPTPDVHVNMGPVNISYVRIQGNSRRW